MYICLETWAAIHTKCKHWTRIYLKRKC